MRTFGIEEEYLLLDPSTAMPRFISDEVSAFLTSSRNVAVDDVQSELLTCQLETSTPPCHTAAEALQSLRAFRAELAKAALKARARAAGIGTAPRMETALPEVTDKRRYHQLRDSAPGIVADQYVNGLHVHVGIEDKDSGVQALNRIRPWLPVIVALSANSPFWQDRDSGFESWRTISYRRWPIQGVPPLFKDAADYEARVQGLVNTGVIIDRGVITWVARLSDSYPTLEVRAADAQLEARDAVLLAVMIRALVDTASTDATEGRPYFARTPEILDAALWQAARHGLNGDLMHPHRGQLAPAGEVLDAFVAYLRPALERTGDEEFVHSGLQRLSDQGTGSQRQRRAFASGGLPALLDLYQNSLSAN
ncbi:glutamate--cysteine ligase [Paenarthrobacter sp. Z7-10]|uniref:carboxylate-amine ligase n=1 Tax=Paenarthrobacter sp. Z7-10 TaxID=2787635 RepID=UPI0022A96E2B|nr:glutamate--cysteine ligase [Paenarthrobacter sp. Z7-10]MCZ2403911.1 glutamate--cysteine ligase [Paenarthrobacter sp. Z7-10]